MKKLLLSFAILVISLTGFTQTLSIDTGGVDINGSTLNYVYSDTTSTGDYRGDVYVEITNTATNPADSVEFQVKRTPGIITCGSYYFPTGHTMCLGTQCIPGDIIPGATSTKRLYAGETIELHVQIQFDPTGKTNEFYEVYEFGNEANNLVSFNAQYESIEDCTNNVTKINNKISINSYPNPANSIVNFKYNVNSNDSYITIHDITGKQVGRVNLNASKNLSSLNTESLGSGIYFYNLFIDGTKTKTNKFIVRH
jgi:hypothetical protein